MSVRARVFHGFFTCMFLPVRTNEQKKKSSIAIASMTMMEKHWCLQRPASENRSDPPGLVHDPGDRCLGIYLVHAMVRLFENPFAACPQRAHETRFRVQPAYRSLRFQVSAQHSWRKRIHQPTFSLRSFFAFSFFSLPPTTKTCSSFLSRIVIPSNCSTTGVTCRLVFKFFRFSSCSFIYSS